MIVLVHGWGYDRTVWDAVRAELPGLPVLAVDLGFFGGPRHLDPGGWPEGPVLGVGHSLGCLWLLGRARARCAALLAVNGFPCFTERPDYRPAVPRRVVAAMARRFQEKPGEVLAAFRQRCGAGAGPAPEDADPARLAEGLAWLMDGDERPALPGLDLTALAGGSDRIVPPTMTAQAFPGPSVTWVEDGHHVLPLQHPGQVAAHIRRCWEALRR